MPQIKISNLPLYTGNTTGAYLVMNNSGQTTTYKVTRENIIGASGTSGTSGSSGSNGSSGTSGDSLFAQTGSFWNTTRNVGITGSLRVSGSSGINGFGPVILRNSYEVLYGDIDAKTVQIYPTQGFIELNQIGINTGSVIGFGLSSSFSPFGGWNRGPAIYQGSISDAMIGFENSGNKITLLKNTDITGSLTVSGSATITGSLNVVTNIATNFKNPNNSGSFQLTHNDEITSLIIKNQRPGIGEAVVRLEKSNGVSSGNTNNAVFFLKESGSFKFQDTIQVSGYTLSTRDVFVIKDNLTGSVTFSPFEIKRNTQITGSLNISGSTSTSVFVSGSILVQKPQGTVLLGGVSFPSITITSGSNTSLLGRGTLSLDNVNDKIILVTNSTTGNKTQIQAIDNTDVQQTIVELPCSSSWNNGLTKFKYPVEITGSLNISTVMTLAQQSPLPTGTVGSLAVSGSNLFYHNGSSWSQIN